MCLICEDCYDHSNGFLLSKFHFLKKRFGGLLTEVK